MRGVTRPMARALRGAGLESALLPVLAREVLMRWEPCFGTQSAVPGVLRAVFDGLIRLILSYRIGIPISHRTGASAKDRNSNFDCLLKVARMCDRIADTRPPPDLPRPPVASRHTIHRARLRATHAPLDTFTYLRAWIRRPRCCPPRSPYTRAALSALRHALHLRQPLA